MKRSRVASVVVMVVLAVVVMLALGASLSGCCWGGKTVKETKTSPVNVETKSTGEQLMDLQKAHESGHQRRGVQKDEAEYHREIRKKIALSCLSLENETLVSE